MHKLENVSRIKNDNFGFAVMMSGNGQALPYMDYGSKTKIDVFYSLPNAFGR